MVLEHPPQHHFQNHIYHPLKALNVLFLLMIAESSARPKLLLGIVETLGDANVWRRKDIYFDFEIKDFDIKIAILRYKKCKKGCWVKKIVKKIGRNLQIVIFALSLHSQSAIGALVQLVRIRACHARGQGFESPTHRRIYKN